MDASDQGLGTAHEKIDKCYLNNEMTNVKG